ncbi:MAG TPA: NAD(P)/FAD-dependent oxidoreductase [Acidimicrobiia bacterium]
MTNFDAVVVGAGPNGLAAAAELTRAGRRVQVIEQADVIGGGTRTEELTLPGFLHDICAAIHPLGLASPFFRDLGLDVEWIQPRIPMSHPLGEGRSGALLRDVRETAAGFGVDADRYSRIMSPLVESADAVIEDFLGPMTMIPRNPSSFIRLATRGALPASTIAGGFSSMEARGVLAGLAAHAIAPFSSPLTGGVALLFATAGHAYGWPLVRGGSQRVAEALARVIVDGGGAIETGRMIASLDELPPVATVILDVMPRAALHIGGDRISPIHRRRLSGQQSGPAVFKVDWALDGAIPWLDEWSTEAGTVHVGGTWEEVAEAEDAVHSGRLPERPFVLVAQQSLFDETRAPAGKQSAWGYCHVPAGSDVDMTEAIERQIERFAPGFRDLILGRHTMNASAFEAHNPNNIGGDIAGGGFGMRKVFQLGATRPYHLGDGLYLCSSATPPGAGVHGMCGYYAARAALRG